MTSKKDILHNLRPLLKPLTVRFGNDSTCEVTHCGTVYLATDDNADFKFTDVLYCPTAAYNLLSVRQLDKAGVRVSINGGTCRFSKGFSVYKVKCDDDYCYRINGTCKRITTVPALAATSTAATTPQPLHRRFGHLGYANLERLISEEMVTGITVTADSVKAAAKTEFCDTCVTSKQHRDPFPSATSAKANKTLELVHVDVGGPLTTSRGGNTTTVVELSSPSQAPDNTPPTTGSTPGDEEEDETAAAVASSPGVPPPAEPTAERRYPERTRNAPDRFDPCPALSATTKCDDEPVDYKAALLSADADFWWQSMDDEFASLLSNDTWELVELPPGAKALDCKWVYKIKRDSKGTIERHKSRLVAKGYQQREGIDFT